MHVEQHDVGAVRGHRGDGLVDVGGLGDDLDQAGAGRGELGAHPGAEHRVVVDDQDAHGAARRGRRLGAGVAVIGAPRGAVGGGLVRAAGSRSRTSVPSPGAERTSAVPPWRAIRSRMLCRTPWRSSGSRSGSKPAPRSRTKTSTAAAPTSA